MGWSPGAVWAEDGPAPCEATKGGGRIWPRGSGSKGGTWGRGAPHPHYPALLLREDLQAARTMWPSAVIAQVARGPQPCPAQAGPLDSSSVNQKKAHPAHPGSRCGAPRAKQYGQVGRSSRKALPSAEAMILHPSSGHRAGEGLLNDCMKVPWSRSFLVLLLAPSTPTP